MLFDARAALAEILADGAATPATPAANGPNVAIAASVAAPRPETAKDETPNPAAPSQDDAPPYGAGIAGGVRTWTGRVVSLEAWRALSDWERHGSTGKVWSGLTHQWEPSKGGAA